MESKYFAIFVLVAVIATVFVSATEAIPVDSEIVSKREGRQYGGLGDSSSASAAAAASSSASDMGVRYPSPVYPAYPVYPGGYPGVYPGVYPMGGGGYGGDSSAAAAAAASSSSSNGNGGYPYGK